MHTSWQFDIPNKRGSEYQEGATAPKACARLEYESRAGSDIQTSIGNVDGSSATGSAGSYP